MIFLVWVMGIPHEFGIPRGEGGSRDIAPGGLKVFAGNCEEIKKTIPCFPFGSHRRKKRVTSFLSSFSFFVSGSLSCVHFPDLCSLTVLFSDSTDIYLFSLIFSFLFSVIKILRQINYSAILASFVYLFSIFSSGFYPSFPDLVAAA